MRYASEKIHRGLLTSLRERDGNRINIQNICEVVIIKKNTYMLKQLKDVSFLLILFFKHYK